MSTTRKPSAKILLHSDGLGTPSSDTVEERARELAKINGHSGITEEDLEQAQIEVHGGHPSISNDGENDMIQSVSGRDMIAFDSGHRIENARDHSDEVVEELVAEGLDEAAHDQMLQAARREPIEE